MVEILPLFNFKQKRKIMGNDKKCTTILLVEDEAIILLATSRSLKRFGYKVISANSGEKAVEFIISNKDIDLVLMDIYLGSGIDGTESARRITCIRDIPIVFLTSHSKHEMLKKAEDIIHYGYIIKGSGDFVLQSSIEIAFELFESACRI